MPSTRLLAIAVPAAIAALLLAGCSSPQPKLPEDAGDPGIAVEPSAAPSVAAPEILDTSELDACTLLSQAEAETLIGSALTEPASVSNSDVASCTFAGDPNGPTAQVELYVGSGAKQQLDIDKDQLQHEFTQPAGIGDEAWQEDGMIWARSGTTWVSIRIVTLNDAAAYVTPLQSAIATVLGRLPS